MRDKPPCGAYLGLRDQLRALAARQKEGGWDGARRAHRDARSGRRGPPGGLRARRDTSRARARRAPTMADYGRFVGRVLAEARAAGASCATGARGTSPTTRSSSRRSGRSATRSAPSAAIAPYVAMARALKAALDARAGRPGARARRAGRARRAAADDDVGLGVRRRLPRDSCARRAIWSQHGYVGGRDPVDDLERALRRKGCDAAGDLDHRDRRRRAAQRRGAADVAAAQVRACARLHRRLVRWYRDPRVTRRVPVHVPRGRPVPDRPDHDRPPAPTPRSPSGTRGAATRARADRPAAAQLLPYAHIRAARARCRAHAPLRLRRLRELLQGPPAARRCSGVEYERVPVDIFAGDTLTDAYAAINPLRETPVLELDDGRAARAVRRDPLVPRRGHAVPARRTRSSARRSSQWLSFEQERVMGGLGNPRFRLLTGRDGRATRRGAAGDRPRARSTVLDAHLAARDWVVGERADDRRPRRCSRTSASPATPASSCPPHVPRGSTASARCRASSTTSSPTRTTRARRGSSIYASVPDERDSDDLRVGRRPRGVRALAERLLRPRRGRTRSSRRCSAGA